MASPSSSTDICNLALDYLEQEGINDIENPSTDTENICSRWYDATRRRVLRLHAWNFSLKRAQLSKSTTPPLFNYEGQYPYPNDLIRMVSVGGGSEDEFNSQIDYELEGNHVLISLDDSAALNIKYVSDFKNVQKMDALFVDLFAIELALRLAFKFTASNKDVARLKELRDDVVAEAHSVDGQERPVKRIQTSAVAQTRRQLSSNRNTSRHGQVNQSL